MIQSNLHIEPSAMKGIDWAFLKQTPVGSKGIVPCQGLYYEHKAATSICAEQILILCDTYNIRIIRNRRMKSGWTRPHPICK